MKPTPNQSVIDQALRHHQAGRLAEAEQLYRQVLAQEPDNAQALHLLGVLAGQAGHIEDAIQFIERAIRIAPDDSAFYNNLANLYRVAGRFEQAVAAYRQAIALKPDWPALHYNLGVALQADDRIAEAVAAYRRALALDPSLAAAHYNLGLALRAGGQLEECVAALRQAAKLDPKRSEIRNNLASALQTTGRLDEAIAFFHQALALDPNVPAVHYNLATAFQAKGQLDEAIASFRQALALDPALVKAWNNLGNALQAAGQLDDAIAAFRRALQLYPQGAEIHSNLASALNANDQLDDALASCLRGLPLNPKLAEIHNTLAIIYRKQGLLDEAIASFARAYELNPDFVAADSNRICTLLYHAGYDAHALLREAAAWDQRHALPLRKSIAPHANASAPDRRLRIGYVSGDFSDHVVGWNLLPLLSQHDHRQFEIFCYANVALPTTVTDELRASADVWRSTLGMGDEQVAQMIRHDGIDILVDLALHTARNRLLVFARKPATIQLSYLGYCGTTGLETIDYRFSDPYLDPPQSDLSCYSETTIRLPRTYWCYEPGRATLDPTPLPAIVSGHITFGCLNNFTKVSAGAMDRWMEILGGVNESRLILHASPGKHLDAVRERFERGVAADRLEFVPKQPWLEYMQTYRHIDVALDPFPYAGGITTCDALWMGVPVITLRGQTAVGRGGCSILSNLGLPELIAPTAEEYVSLAIELARNSPRLAQLRATLRQRMQASPLMDAPQFARDVENAYRQIWTTWCAMR